MELTYCYIEKYRNLDEKQFNFSSQLTLNLNRKKTEFNIDLNEDFIEDFFDISNNNIEDVKAIIGKNGVGKSTLLEYIKHLFAYGLVVSEERNKDILALKIKSEIKIFINEELLRNLKVFINKDEVIISEETNSFKVSENLFIKIIPYDISSGWEIKEKQNYRIVAGTELFKHTSLIYYSNQFDFNWYKNNTEEKDVDFKDISFNNRIFNPEHVSNTYLNYENHIQNPDARFYISSIQKYVNKDVEKKVVFLANRKNKEYLKEYLTFPSHVTIYLDYMLSNARNTFLGPNEDMLLRYERDETTQFLVEANIYNEFEDKYEGNKSLTYRAFLFRIIDSYFRDIETFLIFKNLVEEFKVFERKKMASKRFDYGNILASLEKINTLFEEFIDSVDSMAGDVDVSKFKEGFNNISYTYKEFINYLELKFFGKEHEGIEYIRISNLKYKMNNQTTTSYIGEEGYIKLKTSSKNLNVLQELFEEYNRIFTSNEPLNFELEGLSQGENNLFTFLSELYSTYKYLKYSRVLLLIDEGDLTLHPEWQRRFIFLMLKFLQDCYEDKEIQILFTTHSPLLISDLPINNVIFFDTNKESTSRNSSDSVLSNTFAANIHTIFSEGQYLESTTGEFAVKKINKIIDSLNINDMNYEEFINHYSKTLKTINLIGDSMIQKQLIYLLTKQQKNYNKKLRSNDLGNKLEYLRELEREIQNEIKLAEKQHDSN